MKKIIITTNSNIIGYIDFSEYNKEVIINFIEVFDEYRCKGLGQYLLWYLYDNVYKNKNIKNIIWDDCSDNCRLDNNIYIKVGAQYLYKTGPEMIWKIRTKNVIKKRDRYIENIENIQNTLNILNIKCILT
jgi:hypothetical protein